MGAITGDCSGDVTTVTLRPLTTGCCATAAATVCGASADVASAPVAAGTAVPAPVAVPSPRVVCTQPAVRSCSPITASACADAAAAATVVAGIRNATGTRERTGGSRSCRCGEDGESEAVFWWDGAAVLRILLPVSASTSTLCSRRCRFDRRTRSPMTPEDARGRSAVDARGSVRPVYTSLGSIADDMARCQCSSNFELVLVRVEQDARGFCVVMWFHRFGESPPCWEGVSQGRARACDGRPEPCYSGSTYYKKVLPPQKNHLLHPKNWGRVGSRPSAAVTRSYNQRVTHAVCASVHYALTHIRTRQT